MCHSFHRSRRALRRAALSVLLPVLAACGGAVGQGNAPKLLVITQSGVSATQTSGLSDLRMFECIPSALSSTLYFQDGSSGNFTARVSWSSSDPGTVEVSNGDIEIGSSGSYYAAGTLVPVTAGNAIITADYDGIQAQIAVSVGTPQSITLKLARDGYYLVPSGNAFSLGVGTTQQLRVTGWLDGVETVLDDYASWSLASANDSEATISSSGLLTAVGAGSQALQPVASFSPCTLTNISDPANAISFTVQPIQGIALQPEFSGNPQLIVGNTEKMYVMATLDDGTEQDISGQSVLSSSDASIVSIIDTYILDALAAGGPAVIGASFSGGGVSYSAPSLTVSAITATLQTVSICWTAAGASFSACPASQDPASVSAGSLTPVQYHAVGTYDSGTLSQEITRQVGWSSSDTTAATISSGDDASAGQALGLVAQTTVTITATDSNAQNVTSAQQSLSVQ